MKPIDSEKRRVTNIYHEAAYKPVDQGGSAESGTSFIQQNSDAGRLVGFYIYRMAPGSQSAPHKHGGAEEFVVIDGELIDHDGTVYRKGDVVWLGEGTEHNSTSPNGCIVAVYAEKSEERVGM